MVKTAQKRGKLKRQNSNKRGSRQVRLGLAALVFLVALIISGKLINLVQGLDKPFSPDSVFDSKNYHWSGEGRINLAVSADSLYLFSYDPGTESVNLIKIPEETILDLPRGFGRYPARSVYPLGQSEHPPLGATLLKEGLSRTLALPVDGYLIMHEDLGSENFRGVIEEMRQNPLRAVSLLQEIKTDLSLREFINLELGLRSVRADKVEEEDIGQSKLTSWLLLPDGSRVLGINQVRVQQYTRDQLIDSLFKSEGFSIGIYNATDHPQLAEKAADLIVNMGGNVIFTTNLPIEIPNSIIMGKKSYTFNRLSQIFAPLCLQQPSSVKCQPVGFNLESSRADVNLVLGEDSF